MSRVCNRTRRGTVTIEMAISLPLLLLLVLGVIEYGWMFLKNQGVTNTARQTARVAARYNVTDAEIQGAFTSASRASAERLAIAPAPARCEGGVEVLQPTVK